MLRYTTETISKYWNDSNYRFFALKLENPNNLIILASNKTNSELYGWPTDCIGKPLRELMSADSADRWHVQFQEWRKQGLVSYVAFLEDDIIGWETGIEIINDTLFAISRKLKKEIFSGPTYENHSFFNHFYVEQEGFALMTLSVDENSDSMIIVSVDDFCSSGLSAFVGKDVGVLTPFSTNIINKTPYKKCIQTKKIIHYAERLRIHDEPVYFDVHLTPWQSGTKICVHAMRISEAQYERIRKNISDVYHEYPDVQHLGVCQINFEDSDRPYIIGCNNLYKSLMETTDIKLSHIVNSTAFQTCVHTRAAASDDLMFHSTGGELKRFKMNVSRMPGLLNQAIVVTLLPLERYMKTLGELFSVLTEREKEILTYVVDGMTNRYIASKLGITEGTVKKTIYNSYRKLGICSRVELLHLVHRE